ncbi:hypothetical protein OY671_012689, partial [Metschnikowia pulcherrima]
GIVTIAWTSADTANAQGSQRDLAPAIYAPVQAPSPVTQPQTIQPHAAPAITGGDIPQEDQTAVDPASRSDVPFDFNSFCNAPGADGKPRSPMWVKSCMASAAAPDAQSPTSPIQPR